MQDLYTSGQIESKISQAQRVPQQPTGRLVQVRLGLLSELQDLQKQLDAYITGYVSSRELSDLCAKVRSRLELGRTQTYRLGDSVYWEDIRDDLTRMYEITVGLASLIRERFKEQIESLVTELQESSSAVSGPMRSPSGADVMSILSAALHSVGQMNRVIEDVTAESKRYADAALMRIGHVMQRIFEWIEYSPDQLAAASIRQPAGYEIKLQEEEIEDKRTSRGPPMREAPASDMKFSHKR